MTSVPHVSLSAGSSTIDIPQLGFGVWQVPDADVTDAVTTALEVGYRSIDTAAAYQNEDGVGRALARTDVPREEIFLTTKVPPNADDPRKVLETSLQKLGTDHLDLWLIHWTEGDSIHEDLWRVLLEAQQAGTVRDVGVSNYSLDQIDELTAASGVTPEINQVRWSPTLFDQATVDGHRERGVVLEGYSPFRAGGLDHPVLLDIAKTHGATAAQVVIRWHLQHEIVVIPKSARRERIVDNVDVAGLVLTEDEMRPIDGLGAAA